MNIKLVLFPSPCRVQNISRPQLELKTARRHSQTVFPFMQFTFCKGLSKTYSHTVPTPTNSKAGKESANLSATSVGATGTPISKTTNQTKLLKVSKAHIK